MTSSSASPTPDLAAIGRAFIIPGEFLTGAPYGSGHINDTYAVHYRQAGAVVRYIFQRINPRVFRDIPAMMHNIDRVLAHQNAALRARGVEDASRRALTLIPAVTGGPLATDEAGGQWRVYLFIEGAVTHDLIQSPTQAGAASRAFGEFLALLGDLDGPRLHETIPAFHHTPSRLQRLQEAIAADVCGRAAEVGPEIAFALARTEFAHTLDRLHRAGDLPERVTHNDTKLNNVMLDAHTGEGLCVIDLDTVMPGFAVNDFGDLGRTAANAALEDETDLARVTVRLDVYDALVEGFLAGARPMLTAREIDLLPLGVRLMTYENGVRFLTDHLQGDTYYKIHRSGHNLDRCRNQFKLVAELEAAAAQIDAMVRRHR
jgi:aminoglycoside phosphotransferase (APT) family kinase protein